MLTIRKEFDIYHFEPWDGAMDIYYKIHDACKLSSLELLLENLYPDGISESELNDFLWFESDWLLESLGLQEEEDEEEEEEEED